MSAVVPFPAYPVRHQLERERLAWLKEAARFLVKEEETNCRYCQGRAAGLNDAVIALGGDSVSLCVRDYLDSPEGRLMEWQPMETAPKDGTTVLLLFSTGTEWAVSGK